MHVGLTGEFGAHRVSPRQLLAALQVCRQLTFAQDGSAQSRPIDNGKPLQAYHAERWCSSCIQRTSHGACVWHPQRDAEHWNDGLQGRLVCAEGIVTKASVVRPKWVKSVHYCPATGRETTREYRCALQLSEAALLSVDEFAAGGQ